MCGIVGGSPHLLTSNPLAALTHRGPDQVGSRMVETPAGENLLLGMTRLSIVDTAPMPVPWEAEWAAIAFNGEIYNWRQLRRELVELGHVFSTSTDTEVVLAAYREWGKDCLPRFNGMFALAIWDGRGFFLARDRLGKKPLFYRTDGDGFAFGSELKVFADLTYSPVEVCDALEFYFDSHTPFRGVHSLRPGEWLYWDSVGRETESARWWNFPAYVGDLVDLDDAVDEFLQIFAQSCELRRHADVPVAVFLSGGVDSSLVQSVMRLSDSFTVQFEEFRSFLDEETLTAELADELGFRNHVVRPDREDFAAVLPRLARHIEFPVGSFSIYPLFCLSRAARAAGFEVVLSGEGADELFNGYYRNEILLGEDEWIASSISSQYSSLANRYFGTGLDRFVRMASRHGREDEEILRAVISPLWDAGVPLAHNLAAVETQIFMQPLLTMADRMSMANSLEVRNPFLDHRLVEFSARLAPELRFANGRGKVIVRRALKRSLGEADLGVLRRQVKHGLPAPVNEWVFNARDLDRRAWNDLLIGECLRQLTLPTGTQTGDVVETQSG